MECSVFPEGFDTPFAERLDRFLSDRAADALTGPRRYGRSRLVAGTGDAARAKGMRVWTPMSRTDSPDLILFDHWSEMEQFADVVDSNPLADVVFGQDLCHQVPAVVRHRRGNRRSFRSQF